jgi:hypothetical protein
LNSPAKASLKPALLTTLLHPGNGFDYLDSEVLPETAQKVHPSVCTPSFPPLHFSGGVDDARKMEFDLRFSEVLARTPGNVNFMLKTWDFQQKKGSGAKATAFKYFIVNNLYDFHFCALNFHRISSNFHFCRQRTFLPLCKCDLL